LQKARDQPLTLKQARRRKELQRRQSGSGCRPIRRKPSRAFWAALFALAQLTAWAKCIGPIQGGAEVFYDLRHQTIFQHLVQMYDGREAIDVITLQQQLKNKQLLEEVGGIAYLAACRIRCPPRPISVITSTSWWRSNLLRR